MYSITLLKRYVCSYNAFFRHPDAAKRPSFTNITTLLQNPDFQILKWNEEEEKSLSEEARTLGGPLEAGNLLHKDLQNFYNY